MTASTRSKSVLRYAKHRGGDHEAIRAGRRARHRSRRIGARRRLRAERRHHPGERQGDHPRRPVLGGAGHRHPRRQGARNRLQRGHPQARRRAHQGGRPRRAHGHPGAHGFPHPRAACRAHLLDGAELDRGAEPRQGSRIDSRGREGAGRPAPGSRSAAAGPNCSFRKSAARRSPSWSQRHRIGRSTSSASTTPPGSRRPA